PAFPPPSAIANLQLPPRRWLGRNHAGVHDLHEHRVGGRGSRSKARLPPALTRRIEIRVCFSGIGGKDSDVQRGELEVGFDSIGGPREEYGSPGGNSTTDSVQR